jgi:hypothetical protein
MGLSTSDESINLWVSDAKNFAQAGVAIKYDNNGVKLDSFPTGIIPGAFYFSSDILSEYVYFCKNKHHII